MGACGRGWGYVVGSGIWHGWEHVVGWGHVEGSGGMWQGVGACGRGSGMVWGHVAGVMYVVGGQHT